VPSNHGRLLDEQLDARSRLKRHQEAAPGMKELHHLQGIITRAAITRLKPQIPLALGGYDLFTPPMPLQHDGPGSIPSCIDLCENPVQFGLPCWHIMQSYLRSNDSPIPADFVHPRWFISSLSPPQPAANASLSSDTTPDPTPNPRHYLAGSGETLLAKEAIEAEAFRAQLGSENGERYALTATDRPPV
jgi:hypothetical protein